MESRLDQKNGWCDAEIAEQERLGATSMKVDEVLARHEVRQNWISSIFFISFAKRP